jgi:hypothetical protein
VVNFEVRIPAAVSDESLRSKIEEAFHQKLHALSKYKNENRISEFRVVLLPPGGIMSVERTSKTKRIIDNRKS